MLLILFGVVLITGKKNKSLPPRNAAVTGCAQRVSREQAADKPMNTQYQAVNTRPGVTAN